MMMIIIIIIMAYVQLVHLAVVMVKSSCCAVLQLHLQSRSVPIWTLCRLRLQPFRGNIVSAAQGDAEQMLWLFLAQFPVTGLGGTDVTTRKCWNVNPEVKDR